jgi:hypothetical protein
VTVSTWVAAVSPPAAAERVKDPAAVALKWKSAEVVPGAISSVPGGMGIEQVASVKKATPGAGRAASVTAVGPTLGIGFPKASCASTVTTPEQAPAIVVRAGVRTTSWLALPSERICSIWDAGRSPGALAVTVTGSAFSPRNQKGCAVSPAAMVRAVMSGPMQSLLAKNSKVPVAELERATIVGAPLVAGLPRSSRSSTTADCEQLPAPTLCAAEAKARWSGGSGTIVASWVAGVSGAAAAEIVTVSAAVPEKERVVEEPPAAMVTVPTGAPPQPAPAWKAKPAAGEAESETVAPPASGEAFP